MVKGIKRILLAIFILVSVTLVISSIKWEKVQASTNITLNGGSVTLEEGDFFVRSVAIRLKDNKYENGVRFKSVIKLDKYEDIAKVKGTSEVEWGLILLPYYKLEGELSITSQDATIQATNKLLSDVEYDGVKYKESCIYVYDIPDGHRTDEIIVRGYIKVDGEVKYYTATKQISMAEIAYREIGALEDGSSPLPNGNKDKEYYKDYITENYLKYKVNYYDGETKLGEATLKYKESVGEIETPTKKGHTFNKYYTDKDLTQEFNASDASLLIKGDIDLYAGFSANSYTLKINYLPISGDGFSDFVKIENDSLTHYTLASQEKTVTYGQTYSFNNPSVTGYVSEKSVLTGQMDDTGKEVTVYYSRNSYDFIITHQNANGVIKTEKNSVKYGEKLADNYQALTTSDLVTFSTSSAPTYISTSNNAISVTYSFKTDVVLGENSSSGILNVVNSGDDFSIKYKHTGTSLDWAKLFKIGDVLITNGCLLKYNTNDISKWTLSNEINKLYDGAHGQQSGKDYNWSAVVPYDNTTNEYEVCFKGSNNTIEWYRNGLRVLLFSSDTQSIVSNGGSALTVGQLVPHIIGQLNLYGIEVLNGKENEYETYDSTISNVNVRFTPSSATAYVNYAVTGDEAVPNNASYTLLSGSSYTVEVKMPGYDYTTSSTVTNDKITVTGGNTYTVNYTRKGSVADGFEKTGVNKHITRIGKNIENTSYYYGLDELQGNFYLEFYLTDIFMMVSDHTESTAVKRTPVIQICDGNDYNRWRRFYLGNYTEITTAQPFGEVTASNNWWSGEFNSLYNNAYSAYVKVIRQNNLIQITYWITEYKGYTGYSFNYRLENITSDKINVSLDAFDSAFAIDWVRMEDSSYYSSSNPIPDKTDMMQGVSGYYNAIYENRNCYGANYKWNSWANFDENNNCLGSDQTNICSLNNGNTTGTGDFDYTFSFYQWGCDGLGNTCTWDEAKSSVPMLFMIQKDTTSTSTFDSTNPYNTYYKAFVGCAYDSGGSGENWFVDGGGFTTTNWKNVDTGVEFDSSIYNAHKIYHRAYVYYRIQRVASTITVTQVYIPFETGETGNSNTYNTSATKFTRTVTLDNIKTDRTGNPADLLICITALHGGIEVSGAWHEFQEQ